MSSFFDFRPPSWEDLPNMGLYSDQLIQYLQDKLSAFYHEDKVLTPSMVNNYVKLNLMPKPKKKKYYREHFAYLIVICILKSVLPMGDIQEGIHLQMKMMGIHDAYDAFVKILKETLNKFSPWLEEDEIFFYPGFQANAYNVSLHLIIHAFCFQHFTKNILQKKGFISLKEDYYVKSSHTHGFCK